LFVFLAVLVVVGPYKILKYFLCLHFLMEKKRPKSEADDYLGESRVEGQTEMDGRTKNLNEMRHWNTKGHLLSSCP
jgi:hypothetical protein